MWPYGKKTFNAPAGTRGINVTQDIGLTPGQFSDALVGNIGPFLRWDASPPAAPAGFLGDGVTPHDVTGSPFTYQGRAANFFRIEGPAGAVLRNPGDPNPCPDRPTYTNCIEYPQFTIVGKKAVRAGVEGTRAVYTRQGATTTVDLFGTSAPGAHLQVKGTTIPSTDLDADAASGFYFSRLRSRPPFDPADVLTLRNLTDQPNTRSIVRLTDGVVIDDATYYNSATAGHARGDLVVTAHTTDDQNTDPLTVVGVGELPAGAAADAPRTVTFADDPASPGIAAPPATIRVTSTHGGFASVAVKIAGDVTPAAATTAGDHGRRRYRRRRTRRDAEHAAAVRRRLERRLRRLALVDRHPDLGRRRLRRRRAHADARVRLADRRRRPRPAARAAGRAADLGAYPGPEHAGAERRARRLVHAHAVSRPGRDAAARALATNTLAVHVDPAAATAARLAAVVATPQRTRRHARRVRLHRRRRLRVGAARPGDGAPRRDRPGGPEGAAGDRARLRRRGSRRRSAPAPKATFTMPDTTAFENDFPFAARSSWHLRFRVRAKSALGAASDSVAVVDIAFASDALTGLDRQVRRRARTSSGSAATRPCSASPTP